MPKFRRVVPRSALTAFLVLGVMSPAMVGADLSKYRKFQLGTDLAAIAKQAGADRSQAKVVHSRPALIQELEWRPQPLGSFSQSEPAKEVVFSFYEGELFRIVVNYDRYETEGLTADDVIAAISTDYGPVAKPTASVKLAPGGYGEQEETLGRWEDAQYRFDLIRSSYGPTFRLVGVVKTLEASARTATLDAQRLDDQEKPQREAARIATEEEAARANLEKARLVNKANFRP